MRQHLAFLRYFFKHKIYVWHAGQRLDVPWWSLLWHDMDKVLCRDEYPHYFNAWRFSMPVPPQAKLRHYRRTRHHWQSWVVLQDDGKAVALPIPLRHRLEMIADWQGAAKVTGGTDGTAWYRQHGDSIVLHDNTRARVEQELGIKEPHFIPTDKSGGFRAESSVRLFRV